MKMSRFLAAGCVAALALAAPAHAATYVITWHNVMGDGNFPGNTTSVNIGADNKNTACGTILQGDVLVAVVSLQGGSGDPGQPTTPTGFTAVPAGAGAGYTSLINSDYRASAFYQVVDAGHAGETCSFATSWSASAAGGISWMLMDFRPTSGSPPGTTIDSQNSQGTQDTVPNGTMDAPSATLANSGDLLLGIWTMKTPPAPFAVPGSFTMIGDTSAEGGAFYFNEILTGYQTVNPGSGATGTQTATYTGTFKWNISGLIGLNQPTGGGGGGSTPSYGGLLHVGH